MTDLSLVVPVFNEERNLTLLYQQIVRAVSPLLLSWELIFVDDGSTDGSYSSLEGIAESDARVTVVRFARNFGQTAAMAAGFELARGEVIIPMDADLQNDPADIQAILQKLNEGYDVVSCWRKERKDNFATRKLPSMAANKLISWISGVHLHDYGCTLKGYRRNVMRHVRLYGDMHRFIPILASWAGGRVAEIPVRHHPRQFGESKYGMMRTFKVTLDLITIKFLGKYSTKPMHFFGGAGFLLILAGVFTAIVTLVEKFFYEVKAHRNPLLLGSVFFVILGVQFILIGLIAELMTRTYHESQDKPTYIIKTILNGKSEQKPQIKTRQELNVP
ncbi:MAG TPA: glycosyltransferase family 2 protein [Acidobacteriota bacterium]|jgi:glycosyltransferase involved in cell wall biosynthesis